MKRFIWNIMYMIEAVRTINCTFRIGWEMATTWDEDDLYEGQTPKDALDVELSYWDGDTE